MLSSKQSAEQNKKHNGQPKLRVLQASQIQNYRMLKVRKFMYSHISILTT